VKNITTNERYEEKLSFSFIYLPAKKFTSEAT
jgi:hypothetical protein